MKNSCMRIGELAKRAGVGVETVRFYERRALIAQPPKPVGGGYRTYPSETISVIQFIRQAQGLGFSLCEIEDLLSLRSDPSSCCSDVKGRAQEKLHEIDDKIARLNEIRDELERLIDACPGRGAVRRCSIIGEIESEKSMKKEKLQ